jgi:hypothetical protein
MVNKCRDYAQHDDVSLSRDFGICDAGQVSLSDEQRFHVRPIELGLNDVAPEVGDKHSVALEIQGDADSFHQVREHDLRGGPARRIRIHRGAVDRVAARRVARYCVGDAGDRGIGERSEDIGRRAQVGSSSAACREVQLPGAQLSTTDHFNELCQCRADHLSRATS